MNGFLLLIPFFIIRFALLAKLGKEGVQRAAHFAKTEKLEKLFYIGYQLSTFALLVGFFFTKIVFTYPYLFAIGCLFYVVGLVLCGISIVDFAHPSTNGMNTNGIYQYSRNPMYVSYFLIFLGCSMLTDSMMMVWITLFFQICAHVIILTEERWCSETFGQAYITYKKKVRRYF